MGVGELWAVAVDQHPGCISHQEQQELPQQRQTKIQCSLEMWNPWCNRRQRLCRGQSRGKVLGWGGGRTSSAPRCKAGSVLLDRQVQGWDKPLAEATSAVLDPRPTHPETHHRSPLPAPTSKETQHSLSSSTCCSCCCCCHRLPPSPAGPRLVLVLPGSSCSS